MFKPSQLVCAVVPLILLGCSNVGRFDVPKDPTGVPTVNSIIQQIRCELSDLADPKYSHNETLQKGNFMVAIQLSLTVNDDGSLAPSFTYTNGLFSFNAGAKFEAAREQNFTEKLIYSMKAIQDEVKRAKIVSAKLHKDINPFACPTVVDTNLAGDLGLRESVQMALTSPDLNLGTKLTGTDGAFGGYVSFVITKNLNAVGPTWTLTHFKGPGSLAGVSEVNTDKLIFAFAQATPADLYTGATPTSKAETLLNQILLNQISTQLGSMRGNGS
jgi:hypothetical protein